MASKDLGSTCLAVLLPVAVSFVLVFLFFSFLFSVCSLFLFLGRSELEYIPLSGGHTMAVVPTDIFLSFSSDQADYTDEKGSSVTVNYSPPLKLPKEAKNVTLTVLRATVWWTIPNITEDVKVSITFGAKTSPTLPQIDTVWTIPKGLYTVDNLDELLQRHCLTNGRSKEISMYGDGATNKVLIVITSLGSSITIPAGLATHLGFPTDTKITNTTGQLEGTIAPSIANFDTLQFLNINSNLVDVGVMSDQGRYHGTIAQINLDADPGYQILYQPTHPLEISTSVFQSVQGVSSGRFELVDQSMRPVDTNHQPWTLLLRIRYYL